MTARSKIEYGPNTPARGNRLLGIYEEKGAALMAASPKSATMIVLERPERKELTVSVRSTAPLISHAWSEQAIADMLAKQMGQTVPKRLKDPQADFEGSIHYLSDGTYGMPATAFKQATIAGARTFKGSVTMASLKPMLYFKPDDFVKGLIRINGKPTMRQDIVRLSSGVADIHFRAEYTEWSAELTVRFTANAISEDSVVKLIDEGGQNGIGDWRPSNGGIYGTYEVVV